MSHMCELVQRREPLRQARGTAFQPRGSDGRRWSQLPTAWPETLFWNQEKYTLKYKRSFWSRKTKIKCLTTKCCSKLIICCQLFLWTKYLRGFLLVSERAEQRHMLNTLAHCMNTRPGKRHISEPEERQRYFGFSSIWGGGSYEKLVVANCLKGAEEHIRSMATFPQEWSAHR